MNNVTFWIYGRIQNVKSMYPKREGRWKEFKPDYTPHSDLSPHELRARSSPTRSRRGLRTSIALGAGSNIIRRGRKTAGLPRLRGRVPRRKHVRAVVASGVAACSSAAASTATATACSDSAVALSAASAPPRAPPAHLKARTQASEDTVARPSASGLKRGRG